MHNTRYIFAKVMASFGMARKTKLLTDASDEAYMLLHGEELLGHDIWESCEDVEEVSMEYWAIRKLMTKKKELENKMVDIDVSLARLNEHRDESLDDETGGYTLKNEEGVDLNGKLKELEDEREEIINKAHTIKRRITGIHTKIEVIEQEGEGDVAEQVSKEQEKLQKNKDDFLELKRTRDVVNAHITKLLGQIEQFESEVAEGRKKLKESASDTYQQIGQVNRDMSELSSQLGLLDLEIQGYYGKIGKFMSEDYSSKGQYKEICKPVKGHIALLNALSESISLNRKLANRE